MRDADGSNPLALFVVTTSSERLLTTPLLTGQSQRADGAGLAGPRGPVTAADRTSSFTGSMPNSGFGNPDVLDSPPRNHIRLGNRIKKDGNMVLSLRHDRRPPPDPLVGDAMTVALKD
jgi:hypothetical protein